MYAIERKIDSKFIGTVALIKGVINDEIGHRLWKKFGEMDTDLRFVKDYFPNVKGKNTSIRCLCCA
jgi:hypothetical protein